LISFAIAQDMTPLSAPDTPSPPRLLDQVRDRLRTEHYSIRTESQCMSPVPLALGLMLQEEG
jgi:hypothetical protein